MVVFDVTNLLKSHGSARPLCITCVVSLVLLQTLHPAVTCGKIALQDKCCTVWRKLLVVQAQHAVLCGFMHATESVQLAHAFLN